MFKDGEFYKTKNGSKVLCDGGPDADGDFCMKVISGGHGCHSEAGAEVGSYYWAASEGSYNHPIMYRSGLTAKLRGMDVIGLWEETPKLTLTFETEAQKEAFLAWFLDAGGDQDMSRFSEENVPDCPDYAFYDKENHTITLSKVEI